MKGNALLLRSGRDRPLAIAAIVATVAVIIGFVSDAHARVDDELPVIEPIIGPDTEIVMTGVGAGQNISGFQPASPIVPDPDAPYPTENPSGYEAVSTFAGLIRTASVDDPSATGEMYCINLRVSTQAGIGYESGTWEESNVPNIGYVTYILNNYAPTTDDPASLTPNARAAAVQAAIWYFTDGYVVNTSSATVRAATAAIVADAQAAGPVTEPAPPDVTVTPPIASAPVGTLSGPFTVDAASADVTISVPNGYAMYADAQGEVALPSPSSVPAGTQVWVSSSAATPSETVLHARAAVTVQRGQVYVYDGNNPSFTDAQRLILADTAELEAVAEATVQFFAVGALTVNKSFAGDAVGEQSASQLAIDCGEGYRFTADVPAGTGEPESFVFSAIPVGTTCTITEPVTGATEAVEVVSDAPHEVVVGEGGATATIINTVSYRPGGLRVTKLVTGEAAGRQGEIVIGVVCGDVLDETFALPAGPRRGSTSRNSLICPPVPSAPSPRRPRAPPPASTSPPTLP